MKTTRTKILGGASIAGLALAATLALAPAAHADASRLGSTHPSGMTVLLGDGSVRSIRFTTQALSASTWMGALIPDDGVVLGSDW
jgi:hypothetical protein